MKGLSKNSSLLAPLFSLLIGVQAVALPSRAPSNAARLWAALVGGNAAQTSNLLSHGIDPNVRDSRGTPLLVSAISLIHQDCREERLISNIAVILRDSRLQLELKDRAYIGDDRAALHMAAAGGCVRMVELLLNRGARLNQKNRFDETPLHMAAERGHSEVVKLLISRGADIRLMTKHTRMNPLMVAAQYGHLQSLKVMLRTLVGSDVIAVLNARDTFGNSSRDLAKKFTLRAPTLARKVDAQESIRVIEFANLRVSAQLERLPAFQSHFQTTL